MSVEVDTIVKLLKSSNQLKAEWDTNRHGDAVLKLTAYDPGHERDRNAPSQSVRLDISPTEWQEFVQAVGSAPNGS